jgi:phosphoenolpyruvate carboxylase
MVQYTKENPERIRELQQMYTDWPFFRNFLSNVRVSVSLLVCTVLAAVEKLLTLVSCP